MSKNDKERERWSIKKIHARRELEEAVRNKWATIIIAVGAIMNITLYILKVVK